MRQWLVYGMYLMVLLPLFSINIELPGSDTQLRTPLEPLMALYGVLLMLYGLMFREKIRFRFIDLSIVLFLIAAGISTFLSRDFFISAKAFIALISYAFIFYGSYRLLQLTPAERNRLWNTYTIGFLLLMLYSLVHFMIIGIEYHNTYEMARPFSKGHTLLIAAGAPTFLRALDKAFQGIHRNLFFSYAGFFFLFVLISFSRLYWVVLPFFVFLFAVYYFKQWRWWLVGGATLLVALAAGGLFMLHQQRATEKAWNDPDDHKTVAAQILSITNWRANDSNLERINRWRIGFLMVREAPVTGVGLGNYADEYFEYPTQVDFYEPSVADKRGNAHNLYLGWLFEMGIAGVVAGCVMLTALFWVVIQRRHHPQAFLAAILVINFMLLGLIEDWTLLEKISPYWWLSAGYVAALLHRQSSDL